MTDKRLNDLKTELEELVAQANKEIPLFVQQWEVRLAEQRGKIAEREYTLSENAPQSHENGAARDLDTDMRLALEDAILNGA